VQIDGLYGEWGHCRQATAAVFRTADGRRGQGWLATAVVTCHRGDWVPAEAVGASLRLAPESCPSPGPIVGSWVEASTVPNPGDYVQVDAIVPNFDKSNPNLWVLAPGEKHVKLVMVGVHVVGSTNGHGEMVWGTFEHLGNAPNAAYSYTAVGNVTHNVPQSMGGSWLFTAAGAVAPFNVTHAHWNEFASMQGPAGSINGVPVGTSLTGTSVLRMNPWGVPGGNTAMNTEVIGANASVISQLIAGDVRRQYFQVGTTWTIGGQAPGNNNQVGTNRLNNATIETFVQPSSSKPLGDNCFSCHGSNSVTVSHIFAALKPLSRGRAGRVSRGS
jgi:hypothetical protein